MRVPPDFHRNTRLLFSRSTAYLTIKVESSENNKLAFLRKINSTFFSFLFSLLFMKSLLTSEIRFSFVYVVKMSIMSTYVCSQNKSKNRIKTFLKMCRDVQKVRLCYYYHLSSPAYHINQGSVNSLSTRSSNIFTEYAELEGKHLLYHNIM